MRGTWVKDECRDQGAAGGEISRLTCLDGSKGSDQNPAVLHVASIVLKEEE